MKVQIITDSGSDLTPELALAHGITVIPLQVLIGDQTFRDGVDLTPAQFYQRMREARELPKTSQPTPFDVMTAYQEAVKKGPVLGVHLSSALSGTWQTATMTARSISDSIRVFDTRTGSGGEALMALEAANMAEAGASIEKIVSRLEEMRNTTRTLVTMNTLENAVKGGRVSPVAGMAASLLGIKPIVHVTPAGKVETLEKVRGQARSRERILEIAAATHTDWSQRSTVVAHGNIPDEGAAFAAQVRERLRPKEVILLPIGSTIGTYAAEGAILFSF